MAHYYSERTDFYGIKIDSFLPLTSCATFHIQTPLVWIGLSWIGAAIVPCAGDQWSRGDRPRLPRGSPVLGDAIRCPLALWRVTIWASWATFG